MNKQVKQITQMFLPGFGYRPSGGGHYIVTQCGEVFRDDRGVPVTIPSSPSVSERMNILKRLENAGVVARGEPRERTRRTAAPRLVRDDLTSTGPDHTNTVETNVLRSRMRELKVWGMLQHQKPSVAVALSHLSGDDPDTSVMLVDRIIDGWTLVPSDREPFDKLLQVLSKATDPVKALFGLVREAKGLVQPVEGLALQQQEEVTMITQQTETPQFTLTGSVASVAQGFIQSLKARKQELEAELSGIDGFINLLEATIGGATITSDDQDESEGGQSGHQAQKMDLSGDSHQQKEEDASRASAVKEERKQKVLELMAQGGEWSQRELYEELDVPQPSMSSIVRELVDEGKIVVVDPGNGGPTSPARYGSADFYAKS